MNDIAREIEAINRTVGSRRIPAGDGRSVVLRLARGRTGRPCSSWSTPRPRERPTV